MNSTPIITPDKDGRKHRCGKRTTDAPKSESIDASGCVMDKKSRRVDQKQMQSESN
jgi:hypothetical protein